MNMNDNTRGRWESKKVPVAFAYTIHLTCGVCQKSEVLKGVGSVEGALPLDVGTWRRVANPPAGQHDFPFAQTDLVICGPSCYDKAWQEHGEHLFTASSVA